MENSLITVTTENNLEDTIKILETQNSELAEKALALLTRMSPGKEGYDENMNGAYWSPATIRIHQGLSRNPPVESRLGGLYTDSGDILPTPWNFVPVYMHYSHNKFPQKDSDSDGFNRMCRSEDTITSTRGEKCENCPDLPFRNSQQPSQCKKAIEVYAFNENFSDIFKIQFMKTSYKVGAKLFRQTSSSNHIWERVFSLGTESANYEGGGKYYTFLVTPTSKKLDQHQDLFASCIAQSIRRARMKMKENMNQKIEDHKNLLEKLPDSLNEQPTINEAQTRLTNM